MPDNVVVAIGPDGRPFAYRPNEIVTTELGRAVEILMLAGLVHPAENPRPATADDDDAPVEGEGEGATAMVGPYARITGVVDPRQAVRELRAHNIDAQLNYVYFSHGAGDFTPNPVYASPVYASPVYASPAYASPVYASPVYASPVYASPVYASPVYASPLSGSDAVPSTSSALPALDGTVTGSMESQWTDPLTGSARVYVLDTGLVPADVDVKGAIVPQPGLPGWVQAMSPADVADLPTTATSDPYVARAAGHGSFIAGLIAAAAPGCELYVGRVLDGDGVGDEWTIAQRIQGIVPPHPHCTILSLSFGAPVLDHPRLMAYVIGRCQSQGMLVVASAGNDGVSDPQYPAALPGVISVGALGPGGPAPFTNYGPWVRACAPGVDLVSRYFKWTGPGCMGPWDVAFDGFAIWSGTSFAGPIVAAALARFVMTAPAPATMDDARRYLIDAPWLMRIPGLGTVVNGVTSDGGSLTAPAAPGGSPAPSPTPSPSPSPTPTPT